MPTLGLGLDLDILLACLLTQCITLSGICELDRDRVKRNRQAQTKAALTVQVMTVMARSAGPWRTFIMPSSSNVQALMYRAAWSRKLIRGDLNGWASALRSIPVMRMATSTLICSQPLACKLGSCVAATSRTNFLKVTTLSQYMHTGVYSSYLPT